LNPITKGNIIVILTIALLALGLSSVAAHLTGNIITNSLYPTGDSSKLTTIDNGNFTPNTNQMSNNNSTSDENNTTISENTSKNTSVSENTTSDNTSKNTGDNKSLTEEVSEILQ